ncbi:MAG: hypothetical protein HIU88_07845 [Acidobacteria bacterium]|nr:hypothetical protein [Acidobacteriota bacterium]
MSHLPTVLTARSIPVAELGGMRLDGEVYPLADGWCAVDELEGPAHRAAGLRGDRSSRLIAELGSAAWVWGATPVLPQVYEFCVDLGARARVRAPLVRVRELVLDPGDRVDLGAGAVTSAVRTAVDLARFREYLSVDESSTITELARLGGFGLEECRALLERRRNLPEKQRALTRLTELLG